MKNFFIIFICLAALSACSEKCRIEGVVSDAAGKTLYFEHTGLTGTEVIDSAKIKDNGVFSFKVKVPAHPDFYKLRLGHNFIVIALDSASKNIGVSVSANDFYNPEIKGSQASNDILRLRQSNLRLQSSAKSKDLDAVAKDLEMHKQLAREIILKDTRSAAAYYAINQTIHGYYYMSPYNKEDLPYWSAVATAYDLYYPEYDRSIELKQSTLLAINNARESKLSADKLLNSVTVKGAIDIVLPNRIDEATSLSSMKGKVVLLDFSAYGIEQSSAHTLFLRELYDAYNNDGFDIFQVSVDADKLLWLEKSQNIPWVCVRDENSVHSKYLLSYNVSEIPSFFLLDKDGDIVGRFNYDNIEAAIQKLIK